MLAGELGLNHNESFFPWLYTTHTHTIDNKSGYKLGDLFSR